MAEFIRVPKPTNQVNQGNKTPRPEHTREALAQKIVMCHLIGNFNPDHKDLDDIWAWLHSKGMLKDNGRPNREAFIDMVGVRFLTITTRVRIMIDTLDSLTELTNLGKFNMADLGLDYALDSFIRAQERMQKAQALQAHPAELQAHPAELSTEILAQAEAFFAPATVEPLEVEIATMQTDQPEQVEAKPKATRTKKAKA